MWVHPHRAAHSCHPYWHQSWTQLQLAPGWQCVPTGALTVVFCLVDTAAPWWSCLDFSVLHAPLLRQLLPKLPRHVLLAAPTCLSTLLAMLLVTSTPQGLLLHVWGPGHHCSWPCQLMCAVGSWHLSGFHMKFSQFGNSLGTTLECSAAEQAGIRATHLSNQGRVLRLRTLCHSRKYICLNHSCQK